MVDSSSGQEIYSAGWLSQALGQPVLNVTSAPLSEGLGLVSRTWLLQLVAAPGADLPAWLILKTESGRSSGFVHWPSNSMLRKPFRNAEVGQG